MKKQMLAIAVAAALGSANALAWNGSTTLSYDAELDLEAKLKCWSNAASELPYWTSDYDNDPFAYAVADAMAKSRVKVEAESDVTVFKNVPRGWVKKITLESKVKAGSLSYASYDTQASAIADAEAGAWAGAHKRFRFNKSKAAAGAVAVGGGDGEATSGGQSLAASLTSVLSKVELDTLGVKKFYAGLYVGSLNFAYTSGESTAVADAFGVALAGAYAEACALKDWGVKKCSGDIDLDYGEGSASAAAEAFASGLAGSIAHISTQATYEKGKYTSKKVPELNLEQKAIVVLVCRTKAVTSAEIETAPPQELKETEEDSGAFKVKVKAR